MSDHIGKPNTMIDTPRTDMVLVAWDLTPEPKVLIEHARQLERELNEANAIIRQQQLLDEENLELKQRIKRLEAAGDAHMEWVPSSFQNAWRAAKESKP